MFLEDFSGGLGAVHGYRHFTHRPDSIHEKGQRGDVIEMGMRQKDVIDLEQLGYGKVTHSGAGVHQHIIVEQH